MGDTDAVLKHKEAKAANMKSQAVNQEESKPNTMSQVVNQEESKPNTNSINNEDTASSTNTKPDSKTQETQETQKTEETTKKPHEQNTHHISDADHWGAPDRNYYVFVFLSVLFGFFGLDHMYLRSFGTGTKKMLVNLLTFGMWYVWDIIQIAQDGTKIRKEGLSSPLDWIRGIGRGVFKPVEGGGDTSSQKSYLLYAFLAIFFGWLGADKFYMGYGWQGLAKLLSTWNIFLFLFGLLWILWDSFHAFFMTDSILKDGISPPMPFSFIFTEPIPGDVFKVRAGGGDSGIGCTHGALWCTLDWAAKTFGFPMPPQGLPLGQIYKDLVAPVISVPLIKEVQKLRAGVSMNPVSTMLNPTGIPSVPGLAIPDLTKRTLTGMNNTSWNTGPSVTPMKPEREEKVAFLPAQRGGGIEAGPGPVIAGALTALVVAGGLKGVYDFISKQYG